MTNFMVIDGNSLANRAYYGVPLLSNRDGVVTNAVYGFINMFQSAIDQIKPDKILVTFDAGKKVFRHEKYKDYKANRKSMPDDLASQMKLIRQALELMNVAMLELPGFEADDIIGTSARWAEKKGYQTTIVSGDRDTFQLIDENTRIFYPQKGLSDIVIMDIKRLKDDYNLTPDLVIELKGLMGDSADNIPGVPGVGIKTAQKLLADYGSIENLYQHLEDFKGKKMHQKLEENKDLAFLSKELATIDCNLDIAMDDLPLNVKVPDIHGLMSFYHDLELNNLAKKLETRYSDAAVFQKKDDTRITEGSMLTSEGEIEAFAAKISPDKLIVIAGKLDGRNHFFIKHKDDKVGFSCQEDWTELTLFKGIFEDDKTYLLTDDAKKLAHALLSAGCHTERIAWDAVLTDYLLYPEGKPHEMERMVQEYFNGNLGEERPENIFSQLYYLEEMQPLVRAKMDEEDVYRVYSSLELPLAAVLAKMEIAGVRVDVDYLNELQEEFEERMDVLTQDIYDLAGEEFNLNSPKQLGHILFEVLKLPPIKKTKTGYSTSAAVLEELGDQHEIIQHILDYRQLSKLQSTYIKGFLDLTSEENKLHTHFNQATTATGRLSSTAPNLQNIPIRTYEGKRIRQAILPSKPGQVLLSADYSQIELRVLAHMSGDEGLIESFNSGEDIHQRTASEVFHVPIDEVDANMRRTAKAVNFGIIYGQTDYGLSVELGITRKEAQDYIDRYFARYPQVQAFINATIDQARQDAYVTTLLGRRRYIRDIHSKNRNIRNFAERTAVNAPIQGTAADIIKLAMLACEETLRKDGFTSRMILQVHDELVFEAPPEEVSYLIKAMRPAMEHAMDLDVPIRVDMKVGFNWNEMEPVGE